MVWWRLVPRGAVVDLVDVDELLEGTLSYGDETLVQFCESAPIV